MLIIRICFVLRFNSFFRNKFYSLYLTAIRRCSDDPSVAFCGGRVLLYDPTDQYVTIQELNEARDIAPLENLASSASQSRAQRMMAATRITKATSLFKTLIKRSKKSPWGAFRIN